MRFVTVLSQNLCFTCAASYIVAYLLLPAGQVEHVDNRLDLLLNVSRDLMREWREDSRRLIKKMEGAYGVMQYVGSPLAIVEAMGYVLKKWSEKQSWVTEPPSAGGPLYSLVDPRQVTALGRLRNFPPAFVATFYKAALARQQQPNTSASSVRSG